jgi:hypothetical protein
MKYLLILFGLLSVLAEEVQLPEASPSEEFNKFLKEWDHLEGNTFVRNLFELKEKLKAEGSVVALLLLENFINNYKYNANNSMLPDFMDQISQLDIESLLSQLKYAFDSSNQKGTRTDPYKLTEITDVTEV